MFETSVMKFPHFVTRAQRYLTATMGHMVGESGRVVGVDHLEELVSMAATNIGNDPAAKPLLDSGHIQLHTCDGRQGKISDSGCLVKYILILVDHDSLVGR